MKITKTYVKKRPFRLPIYQWPNLTFLLDDVPAVVSEGGNG